MSRDQQPPAATKPDAESAMSDKQAYVGQVSVIYNGPGDYTMIFDPPLACRPVSVRLSPFAVTAVTAVITVHPDTSTDGGGWPGQGGGVGSCAGGGPQADEMSMISRSYQGGS